MHSRPSRLCALTGALFSGAFSCASARSCGATMHRYLLVTLHCTYPNLDPGRWRTVERPPVPPGLWLRMAGTACSARQLAERIQQRQLYRRHVWWSIPGLDLGSLGVRLFAWLVCSCSQHRRRRGAVAIACVVSIVGVLIQFLTPKHGNGMLLAGKLINGFALGSPVESACIGITQRHRSRHVCLVCWWLLRRGVSTCSARYHDRCRKPMDCP